MHGVDLVIRCITLAADPRQHADDYITFWSVSRNEKPVFKKQTPITYTHLKNIYEPSVEKLCGLMEVVVAIFPQLPQQRSEEHTSELQPLMRISYAVFCLKKKISPITHTQLTSSRIPL